MPLDTGPAAHRQLALRLLLAVRGHRRRGLVVGHELRDLLQLHAEAVDNAGGRGVSDPVQIVVTVVPVVTWVQPPDGSSFPAGSPIVLRARATDSDGTVSFVDFFATPSVGPRVFVGRSTFGGTNNTYTVMWSNAPAGQFRLHAEAVDNAGVRGISDSVQIVVTGGAVPVVM